MKVRELREIVQSMDGELEVYVDDVGIDFAPLKSAALHIMLRMKYESKGKVEPWDGKPVLMATKNEGEIEQMKAELEDINIRAVENGVRFNALILSVEGNR